MTTLEKIEKAITESKQYPDPTIEYNFELPDVEGVTPTNLFGVRAVFNNKVNNINGYQVTYKY